MIVVAGHLCLDIIPDLSGSPSGATLADILRPGQPVNVGPATLSTGGAVSNTGLALHRLGVPVRLMGKVGNDLFGQAIHALVTQLSPALGEAVKQMLAQKGVEFHPTHKLATVDATTHELAFEGKDSRFKYDLLVAIPPHRGPRVAREAGLTNEAGWIPVDRSTLRTQHDNVFALGDVTTIPIPGRWKPEVLDSFKKAQAHTALADIHESIDELMHYRRFLLAI